MDKLSKSTLPKHIYTKKQIDCIYDVILPAIKAVGEHPENDLLDRLVREYHNSDARKKYAKKVDIFELVSDAVGAIDELGFEGIDFKEESRDQSGRNFLVAQMQKHRSARVPQVEAGE